MQTVTFFTKEELEIVNRLFRKLDDYGDGFIKEMTRKERIRDLNTDDLVWLTGVLRYSSKSEVCELHFYKSSKNYIFNSIESDKKRIEQKKNEIKEIQKAIRDNKHKEVLLAESENLEEFFKKLLVNYQ